MAVTNDDTGNTNNTPRYATFTPDGKGLIIVKWFGYNGTIIETVTFRQKDIDSALEEAKRKLQGQASQLQTDTVRSVPVPVPDVSRAGRPNHPKTPRTRRT